jgi:nicotinamide-nucleotide amidase
LRDVSANVPTDNDLALLAVRAGAVLLGKKQLAATAESCTGGYVAKLLTDVPGSSRWFEGGVVAYSNEQKQRHLGVSPTTLSQHGAVSEQVVIEMAVGALLTSNAGRAIAISGVAGPDGGTAMHPVGDVWFARAQRMENGAVGATTMHRRFSGDRDAVRRQAAAYALELLMEG